MDSLAQEIYNLVRKKMREQGAYSREAYRQMVDETIDYFYEKGKMHEDINEELLKDQLMKQWDRLENKLGEEQP